MKWTTWILFALAVALVTGVLAMVTRQSNSTPEDFFATVQSRMSSGRYDREQAVENLDQVLESAQEGGDSELAARVRLLRGQTLRDMGAYERARADFLAVAALRPADPAVEEDLVELEQRAGDYHAALARAQRMIDRDPSRAHPRVLLGRLHRLAGDKALARGRESLGKTLVPSANEQANDFLTRSVALDPKDPRRIAIAHRLRDLLRSADPGVIEEVLDAADAASAELEAARAAWTDSLEHGVEPEAFAGLVDLFERAGQTVRAVDLATTTVRFPSMHSNPEFARTLMHALSDLGRWRFASEIAAQWGTRSTNVPADFLLECCEVLWRGDKPDALNHTANVILGIGTQREIAAANFYIGLYLTDTAPKVHDDPALARRTWQGGSNSLLRFTETTDSEPFPGARALAWKRIALAAHELLDKVTERTALTGYVQLEPQGDGEAWLRLAEIELDASNAPYREVDLHFARGMALLPKRSDELLPRWTEIGTEELRSQGIDMENVRANLLASRPWNPPSDAAPYVRYKLAEVYVSVKDWMRAGAQVRALLEQVPGFVPALDLSIDIAGGQGKRRDRVDAIVSRVRRAGPSAKTDAILREMKPEDQDPSDLLGLMRADPERTGRISLARGLARRGYPRQALELLALVDAHEIGLDGRVLQARLHLAQHEPDKALALLAVMEISELADADGILLFVRAALDAGDTARATSFAATIARAVLRPAAPGVAQAKQSGAVDRGTALQVADMLLVAGEVAAAQPILAALDSTRELRGADVLLRIAAEGVLRGSPDDARGALERARAFDTKGAADFVALLLSIGADKNADMAELAGEVEAAGYVRNLLTRAQNLIIQKHTSEARAILDVELAGPHGRDPWWNLTGAAAALQSAHAGPPDLSAWLGEDAGREAERFLTGAGDVDAAGKPDPRRALGFVWAARSPQGAALARAWLAHVDPAKQGDLWPEWILASLEAAQGLETHALERLRRLIAHHPGFGPAWELEEQLIDQGERSDEERAHFEKLRDAALGSSDGTQAGKLITQARERRDAGALDEALKSAREALDADAWSLDARILLARLQVQAGHDEAALATLQAGTELEAPDDGRPWPRPASDAAGDRFVRDYLELIVRMLDVPQGPLTRARGETLLKALAKERPDDPRVVLAQAELDLDADERSPSMGVARAFSRLELFRSAHKSVPLDDLGEGSVAGWTGFYARLDPVKAQTFVEGELSLDPTRLSTWLEVVHVDEAAGDTAGALEKLGVFARLAPRGDVLREVLRLRSLGDMTPKDIEESARAIVEAEGRSGPDAELLLLQARCYLNLGPRFLGKVFELMNGLEAWRDVSHGFRVRLAVLSATAWMSRGTPEDVRSTQQVLGDVRDEGDAYQRAYVRVLWELAHAP